MNHTAFPPAVALLTGLALSATPAVVSAAEAATNTPASQGTESQTTAETHKAGTLKDLETALTNAKPGDTISLTANIEISGETTINFLKGLTLDLNGHTITETSSRAMFVQGGSKELPVKITSSCNGGRIVLKDAGNFEQALWVYQGYAIVDVEISVEQNDTNKCLNAIVVGHDKSNGATCIIEKNANLSASHYHTLYVASNSNVEIKGSIKNNANNFAIVTNGNEKNTNINISDGACIESSKSAAIYFPSDGNLVITGGTIKGTSGVEIRGGTLNISGNSTIEATGTFSAEACGSGSTTDGVAIAVSQHATNLPINVTINRGTFTASGKDGKAFYENDLQDGNPKGEVLSITGGTFNGAIEAITYNEGFITGGTFSAQPPAHLIADGYMVSTIDNQKWTVAKSVAQVDGTTYTSLQEAVTAASTGATIKMTGDVVQKSNLTINKAITFDLGGHTLTAHDKLGAFAIVAAGTQASPVVIKNGTIKAANLASTNQAIWIHEGSYVQIDVNILVEKPANTVGNPECHGIVIGERDGVARPKSVCEIMPNASITACGIPVFSSGYSHTHVRGKVTATTTDFGAIQGHGNFIDSDISIYDTAVVESKDLGVYFPQEGKLTITGGKITGLTAVYFKGTQLEVSGGEFIATREPNAYLHDGSGANATGDALVIERCNYPAQIKENEAKLSVSVCGGTFKATQGGFPIAAYLQTKDGKYDPARPLPATGFSKFISGGTFYWNGGSTFFADSQHNNTNTVAPASWLADGYSATYTGTAGQSDGFDVVTSGNNVAKVGEVIYTDIAEALKNATTEDTVVTVMKDVSIDNADTVATVTIKPNITVTLGQTTKVGKLSGSGTVKVNAGPQLGALSNFTGKVQVGDAYAHNNSTNTVPADITVTAGAGNAEPKTGDAAMKVADVLGGEFSVSQDAASNKTVLTYDYKFGITKLEVSKNTASGHVVKITAKLEQDAQLPAGRKIRLQANGKDITKAEVTAESVNTQKGVATFEIPLPSETTKYSVKVVK